MTEKVFPETPEKGEENETVDFFEILEDRYGYEGFNKFMFALFWYVITYHMITADHSFSYVAGQMYKLKSRATTISAGQLERREYHKWALEWTDSVIADPKFFDDTFSLLRVGISIQPTGCNHSRSLKMGAKAGKVNGDNGLPKSSNILSYEQKYVCPVYSPHDNKEGLGNIVTMLKEDYGVFGEPHYPWTAIYIPFYSAEIHPSNLTAIYTKQSQGVKQVLAKENDALRIKDVIIELLNPYDHAYVKMNAWVDDEVTKSLRYNNYGMSLTPKSENLWYVAISVIFLACVCWFTYTECSKFRRWKKNKTLRNNAPNLIFATLFIGKLWLIDIILCYYISFFSPFPTGTLMNNAPESVQKIEDITMLNRLLDNYYLQMNRDVIYKSMYGLTMWGLLLLFIKRLSFHSGGSVLANTLSYAFNDLMDTFVVIAMLLGGLAASGYTWFGALSGSRDFHSYFSSANTIARLSFGMYEYDEFMNDGLGAEFDGIGMGDAYPWKYLMMWITFILLSTIIINILIAVISDGFEVHKDMQRLRTRSGETLLEYFIRRTIYLLVFQYFRCLTPIAPSWIKKMYFSSSEHAAILLKYSDAEPDGLVFDKKLQEDVLREILRDEASKMEDMRGNKEDISEISKTVRRMTIVPERHSFLDTSSHESIERIPERTTREFFSHIPNYEVLEIVIVKIFEIQCNEDKQNQLKKKYGLKDGHVSNVCKKIWELYKHTDEEFQKKLEARVEGNHVRKVMEPMMGRLKSVEGDIRQLRGKMDEILVLLKKKL